MRREGCLKVILERLGGLGSGGVEGTGSGFEGGAARRRGVRRGSFVVRSDGLKG